jgi:hypothetical protein
MRQDTDKGTEWVRFLKAVESWRRLEMGADACVTLSITRGENKGSQVASSSELFEECQAVFVFQEKIGDDGVKGCHGGLLPHLASRRKG